MRLGRHRNNFEPIRDEPCEVPVGRWVSLEVRLRGSAIEVRVDGKSAIRHDDGRNALPAGAVGLRAWQQARRTSASFWVKRGEQTDRLEFKQTEPPTSVSGHVAAGARR